jgi:hypothetical protein
MAPPLLGFMAARMLFCHVQIIVAVEKNRPNRPLELVVTVAHGTKHF